MRTPFQCMYLIVFEKVLYCQNILETRRAALSNLLKYFGASYKDFAVHFADEKELLFEGALLTYNCRNVA